MSTVFRALSFKSLQITFNETTKKETSNEISFFVCKDYEKDIFGKFAYDFELSQKSRRSRVYHQCGALYITNTQCCISSSRRSMHLR